MKFAYIVMYELRSLPKTINDLYSRIIDYYDADVFLICQNQFEDDEERAKLFSRRLVKSEFYTKPNPTEYFNNSSKLSLNSYNNWNAPYVLQIHINFHKCVEFIRPFIDEYDYFISLRVDLSFLFDFPPPSLFETIPHGIYSFDPEYSRWWGGSGSANFIHKSFIIDYLESVYTMMIDSELTPKFREAIQSNKEFNAEALIKFALATKGLKMTSIDEINFYITYTSLDDYYTWARPCQILQYPNVQSKYHEQYTNALSALDKWNAGWRWGYSRDMITLVSPEENCSSELQMSLYTKYMSVVTTPSDINEHLPVLLRYTKQCSSVVECGVRDVVSSYAFAYGLVDTPNNQYLMVDPKKSSQIEPFLNLCRDNGINASFVEQSDLDCPLVQTDLLFIDTWHIYGHLKRELARWNTSVNKFIILHDTTVDEWLGETVRVGWDAVKQSRESGIPVEEIRKGLWPAVTEFLNEHPEWIIEVRLTNNNGLTVLKRI